MLINSPKDLGERERRTILDFVARGGSLLVLGDHTDVFGLMKGFNSLLGPLGIRFRFDSAYKARETWRGCQAAAPDAIAWGWDNENPGVAVGASLELSGSARPLLVGRYGFSDIGIRENVMGSFLGNYHYDKGERLGDVVLVATTTYGRGRVVVWGDTSAFQGVSSNYSQRRRPDAGLAVAAGGVDRTAARPGRGGARVAGGDALALDRPGHGERRPWSSREPARGARGPVGPQPASTESSRACRRRHGSCRSLALPGQRPLQRQGQPDRSALYEPASLRLPRHRDGGLGPRGDRTRRGIAFVAPQRSFTRWRSECTAEGRGDGAVVILTVGQPDAAGSKRLLDAHGLTLLPRPMGTVTPPIPGEPSRTREAAQVPRRLADRDRATGDPADLPGVEIIYRHGEDVVALFRRVGRGGLLLIADTRFFSDMNVEDMSGYWLGNLALIHDLFQRYLGADPDAVKPLFRSPVKPQ